MRIGNDYFKTCKNDIGDFAILITSESDISADGGYSFENVTNEVYLNLEQCKELVGEILEHIEEIG